MNRLDTLQVSILQTTPGERMAMIREVRKSRNSYTYKPKKSAKTKQNLNAKATLALDKLSPAEFEKLRAMFEDGVRS